ncbi:MAG: ABC transporter permease [Bacillota bacterium]
MKGESTTRSGGGPSGHGRGMARGRPGSLRRTGAIAVRIITQFRRDPRTIALIFVAPVLVMSLLGYVITEKTTTLTVAVVRSDQGPVSLVPVLERVLEGKGFELSGVRDQDDLVARVREGEFRAGLIVGPGFSADIFSGRGAGSLRLVLEGSDAVLAADISRRFAQALQELPEALAATFLAPGAAPPTPPGQPVVDYVYGGPDLGALSYFAPGYVAFFAFFFTFLLTSVSFLRERASGTMERLLASPVQRSEIVVGYLVGFGVFALGQSLVILLFAVYALGVKLAGSLGTAFVVEASLVAVAVVMGIFFSFYARNELQVIQFIPIVIIPQIVLSGFITPLETMHEPLRWLALAMPMTYANEALRAVIIRGLGLGAVLPELAILGGFIALFTLLAARLIQRRIA